MPPDTSRPWRFWPTALLLLFIVVSGLGVLALYGGEKASQPTPIAEGTHITEAEFLYSVRNQFRSEDQEREYRASRADHRLIANAILTCKERFDQIYSMPRQLFSTLLLDLTPRGSHGFSTAPEPPSGGAIPVANAAEPSPPTRPPARGNAMPPDPPIRLTTEEWELLALSDAVTRMRLMATAEKKNALNPAVWMWWVTLGVSGAATFFVTLQAKLRRPPDATEDSTAPKEPPEVRDPGSLRRHELKLRKETRARRIFDAVAICAILLSIIGTSLTALRQDFDPTRALVLNERALVTLRKLHHDVVLSTECKPAPNGQERQVSYPGASKKTWATELQKALEDIISPYSPGNTSQRKST